MKALILFGVLYSTFSFAHEVMLNSQHLELRKQEESGEQHDVFARIRLSDRFDVGAQGTYLERFDLYEKRVGGVFTWRPERGTSVELRHFQGQNAEILPRREWDLIVYHSLAEGITPYFIYKDAGYSVTRLHAFHLGAELEKWRNIILVPQIMFGKATFIAPAETRDVHSYGLRLIYNREGAFSLFGFTYKGTEASQMVIGESNDVLDTFSGGVGAGVYLTPSIQAELSVDHTDYKQLDNQFITTTFNLKWTSL